jgi:hypothetical protein
MANETEMGWAGRRGVPGQDRDERARRLAAAAVLVAVAVTAGMSVCPV